VLGAFAAFRLCAYVLDGATIDGGRAAPVRALVGGAVSAFSSTSSRTVRGHLDMVFRRGGCAPALFPAPHADEPSMRVAGMCGIC